MKDDVYVLRHFWVPEKDSKCIRCEKKKTCLSADNSGEGYGYDSICFDCLKWLTDIG